MIHFFIRLAKQLGVQVGLLNDRVSLNIAKSQIGFFNIIVAPFLTTFASVFVDRAALTGDRGREGGREGGASELRAASDLGYIEADFCK